MTTFGNNADTYANWSNYLAPVDNAPRPVSPTGNFTYAYTNQWAADEGARPSRRPTPRTSTRPRPTSSSSTTGSTTSTTRSASPRRPATSRSTTAARAAWAGTPIRGLVQAGAASGGRPTYTGRDNAYMLTLDDGIPPWSGMFLWEPIDDAFEGPYRDGSFDMTRHPARVHPRPVEPLRRRRQRPRLAAGRLDGRGLVRLVRPQPRLQGRPADQADRRRLRHRQRPPAASATGTTTRTRRPSATSATTSPGRRCTPTARSGRRRCGTSARRWSRRTALAKGAEVAARLVTDGMPLTAPDPSFLDARDGILSADLDRYHGDNTDLIWSVFAKRGAGASRALATPATTPTRRPAFDHPARRRNGTAALTLVNATHGPADPERQGHPRPLRGPGHPARPHRLRRRRQRSRRSRAPTR